MSLSIRKGKVTGRILPPPSKSVTHRALFCAAMAQGQSRIAGPLTCDDTQASAECLKNLGIRIEQNPESWTVFGGTWEPPQKPLDCRESGTTWRFLTALLRFLSLQAEVTGSPGLLKRPIEPLETALRNLEGEIAVSGDVSSQFLSALLLSAPLAKKPLSLRLTTPLASKAYVTLTLETQKRFGVTIQTKEKEKLYFSTPSAYQATDIFVEKDWSASSVWIAAGLLTGKVMLEGLSPDSSQADRRFLDLVREMGGDLSWRGDKLIAKKSMLEGTVWDFTPMPDSFPAACVLAASARGHSTFRGLERLSAKESDRPQAMQTLLTGAGVRCRLENGVFHVEGDPARRKFYGVEVISQDHRVVMAAALLGLLCDGVTTIRHPESVEKSYPDFWKIFPLRDRA